MTSERRILIVESDPVVRGWLCQVLRTRSFQVSVAETLREALSRIASGPGFAAVICDHNLPDGTCLELLAGLRSPQNEKIPVLLTSGGWMHSLPSQSGIELLPKPFDAAQLVAALERLIQSLNGPEAAQPDLTQDTYG